MPYRFPPASRLRRRSEFTGVFDQGTKKHGRLMSVFVLARSQGNPRIGIAASKKLGGAVTRNLAKRRMREVFRLAASPMGIDVVVIPRRELLAAPFESVQREFASLVDVAVRHGRRSPPSVGLPRDTRRTWRV
jgi:ribonuclease P protein component